VSVSEAPLSVSNLSLNGSSEEGVWEIEEFSYEFRACVTYEIVCAHAEQQRALLNLLTLQQLPHQGEIYVVGEPVACLDPESLSEVRNQRFGMLFEAPFLLPAFSVLENVAMPLFKIARVEAPQAKLITEEVLDLLEMRSLMDAPIADLSFADQHLVAIARAVVHHPKILVLDNFGARLSGSDFGVVASALRRVPSRIEATVLMSARADRFADIANVRLKIDGEGCREVLRRFPHE
jgi:lipoprotein-releasing system ATP-binding protein